MSVSDVAISPLNYVYKKIQKYAQLIGVCAKTGVFL